MAKDPAFLFYPNDYIGGTMGMTFEEKGAYMELLMMQFNRGHMEGHMVAHTIGQLWDKIQDKFIQDDKGLWYNERLEEEKNKRKSFTNSRKNNLSGKNQYSEEGGHTSSRMEDENEDEDINKDKGFSEFWNLYNKKIAKVKCEKKWNKLKDAEREQIMKTLPKFLSAIKDKQFQPHPDTYLNQRRWEDEFNDDDIIKDNTRRLAL